jgi:hypothetical protein
VPNGLHYDASYGDFALRFTSLFAPARYRDDVARHRCILGFAPGWTRLNSTEIRTTGSTSPRTAKLAAARAAFNVVTIAGNSGIGHLCDLCQGLTIVNSLSIDRKSNDSFLSGKRPAFIHTLGVNWSYDDVSDLFSNVEWFQVTIRFTRQGGES